MEMAQPVKIYAGTVNIDALKLGEWKVSEEELEANKKKMMAIEDSIIAGYLEAVKMTCERSECGTCKFERLCKTAPKSWDWQTMQKAIDTAREEAEAEIRRQEGNT
jgi:Tfp pilus assembly protein PilX